jgi:hypothetical protein
MGCLLDRKAQIIFVSASSVDESGKKRRVVIESRPGFAILKLNGSKKRYPIAWEMIYEIAKQNHEKNLRLEAAAEQRHKRSKARAAGEELSSPRSAKFA